MQTTHRDISNDHAASTLPRKMLAELVGTFFLTLVSAGVEIVAVLEPGHIDRNVKATAPALVVAAMIYSVGDVSGAHLNPVITLAFAVRRSFPLQYLPAYVLAQTTGAITAALCFARGSARCEMLVSAVLKSYRRRTAACWKQCSPCCWCSLC